MKMNKNTKIITGSVVALAVIVVLGIVYAAFTQQLNINGSATGRSSKWKVYFSRLTGPTLNGTAKELEAPEIKNGSTTIGDYSVSVTSPGDYIEYEFDVTNDGDYDAKLTGLTKNSNTGLTYTGSGSNKTIDENNVKSQIEYTLTYEDGTTVLENDTLKSKETKTMKLKLLYKTFSDASLLPTADVSISGLGITLTYSQDSNAKVNSDGTTPYVKPLEVGDQITVANETYHIISVPANSDYVIALKDEILKDYIPGPNIFIPISSSFGSTNNYDTSTVKEKVDSWENETFINSELKEISGYTARLITLNELLDICDYKISDVGTEYTITSGNTIPNWLYGSNKYWTMSPYNDSSTNVWIVNTNGNVGFGDVSTAVAVRPVINVYKSALETNNNAE